MMSINLKIVYLCEIIKLCLILINISHELDVEAAENMLFKKESGIMEISSIAEVRKILILVRTNYVM